MAVVSIQPKDITSILKAVPKLVELPATPMWVNYDAEADVLYISLRRPQHATDSQMRDDGVIIHRHGKRIVGLTILEASSR
jgi:uncharacterized protein YuzE